MEIAARDLHVKYDDFLVFPLFPWRVPNVTAELLTPKEKQLGIYPGDAESTLILPIMPGQVKMEADVAEYPNGLREDSLLTIEGKLLFAWTTRDLSLTGVLGNRTVATKRRSHSQLYRCWLGTRYRRYLCLQQSPAWK